MLRLFIAAAAVAALASCKPTAQVTLSVEPGFYPSAIAHERLHDRFFVGSHSSGAIALVRRDGTSIALVRPENAASPVVQLVFDPSERRLWALTPDAVERFDPGAVPSRRTAIATAAPGGRFVDLAVDRRGQAFVLDAASGEILVADAGRGGARVIAKLPHGDEEPRASRTGPQCTGAPATQREGALLLLPDGSALIGALGDKLWRIDARTAAVEPVRMGVPLAQVSQLVLLASDPAAHHVAVLRGRANEVVTLHLAPDGRRAIVDAGTRMRFDMPLHGAHDGSQLVLLLGRLRHHPDFCGDGRPNLPPRFATYSPSPRQALITAERPIIGSPANGAGRGDEGG